MSNQLFPEREIASDSPRIAWVKRLGLQVWRTPIDGLCECPETGEEIKAWSCCTIQELDRLSIRAAARATQKRKRASSGLASIMNPCGMKRT